MYEIIEKNQYGVKVKNTTDISVCEICKHRYLPLEHSVCKKCYRDSYYLPDSEAEKLESEKPKPLADEIICIQNDKIRMLEDTLEKVIYSQKELIDLQNENKQLKERVKELEGTIENMKAIAINLQQPDQCHTITSVDYPSDNETEISEFCNDGVKIFECNSCGMLMEENEPYNNYCPNCGRKIKK